METVVLLGRELGRSREHVYLDYEPSKEIDLPGGATYEQIKAYVLEHTGLKVSHLYIAQVKQAGVLQQAQIRGCQTAAMPAGKGSGD